MDDNELDELFGKTAEDTLDKKVEESDEKKGSETVVDVEENKEEEEKKEDSSEDTSDEEPEEDTPDKDTEEVAEKKLEKESEPVKKPAPVRRPAPKTAPKPEPKPAARRGDSYMEKFPLSFKSFLKVTLALSIVILIVFVAFHPYFRVRNITIEGNYAVSDEEIMDALGIEYNSHMFNLYGSACSDLKNNNPYIRDIDIDRDFPSSMTIKVNERRKLAYIKTPDGYIAVDEEGMVLEFSASYSDAVRPVMCGLNVNSAVLGHKIDITDDSKFRQLIVLLSTALSEGENERIGYSLFENIKEVRIVPSGIIFMMVYLPDGTSLQVKLANMATIGDDIHWLAYAIENDAFKGLPDGVLDMTDSDNIYREYGYEIPDYSDENASGEEV